MAAVVPDILARIVEQKRISLARLKPRQAELERQAAERSAARNDATLLVDNARLNEARDFRAALLAQPPSIISEVKKASPSKGIFTEDFHPASIARAYADGGAAALSVLTDEEFFHGSLGDLETARASVAIPVLRKDFTIHELQVVEAAAHGADAILLIAAILTVAEMRRFRELAERLHMAALVEIHVDDELGAALDSGASIVGVNNRDLHTFQVSLETSERLAERIPAGIVRVAESGIHSSADVARLRASGFSAFLVGEHLMKSGDPAGAIRALRS
jgi:indole-3-glycerol phosphate synthase